MPILQWLTRDQDLKAADRVPYRLLDEVPELSLGGGDNLLVQGDNLEALRALLPLHAGRVKCIYIESHANVPTTPPGAFSLKRHLLGSICSMPSTGESRRWLLRLKQLLRALQANFQFCGTSDSPRYFMISAADAMSDLLRNRTKREVC